MKSRRMVRAFWKSMVALIVISPAARAQENPDIHAKHVNAYFEKGYFGGWPANHGMWNWGNEMLVGFSRGQYKDLGEERHNIDREKQEEHLLARSMDGGETWTIENPLEKGDLVPRGDALHGIEIPGVTLPPITECPGDVEFTHPDFAMTLRMNSTHGPGRFEYSYDRGKTWEGPFEIPNMGTPGVAARNDYIVDGPHSATFILTAAKQNGREGRVFAARTEDGCKTWKFLSWIGPEIPGYSIMPSTVRLSDTELLTTLRVREPNDGPSWIEAYASKDNGLSWEFLNRPVESTGEGNPPSMIKLQDGRVCLTYGYRAAPFNMCAKISSDGGKTWSDEIILRTGGGGRDIGYPRTLQRPDGKVVTTYYWWEKATGPERYIAATIWDPSDVGK